MGTERALDIWQSLLPYTYPSGGDCFYYEKPFLNGSCLMTISTYQVCVCVWGGQAHCSHAS